MNIEDLYTNVLCEDENKGTIDRIISFIKSDGFDMENFSLVTIENYR